jgi:archaellum biogenesis ATPase FlaH
VTTLSKEQIDGQLKKAGITPTKEIDISFDDINSFGSKDSLRKMFVNAANYNKMLSERLTLINDSLTAAIPFTRENLYLFCAYTGSGKSTVAANISYPLWKQKKKVLVISNEETELDVIFRIACLELSYSFNDYKKGYMPQEQQMECFRLFQEITEYVKVIDVVYKEGITTKIEGVKKLMDNVKGQGFSCVLIDYFQLIKDSINDKDRTRYDVLNDLRIWLGQYIKGCEIPVVLFVQLYSQGKRPSKDIDMRIKECSAIVEPASVIIEVVPNFEDSTSSFICHKDRFGVAQGHQIVCPFDKGRYLKQLSMREQTERKLDRLVDPPKDPIRIITPVADKP